MNVAGHVLCALADVSRPPPVKTDFHLTRLESLEYLILGGVDTTPNYRRSLSNEHKICEDIVFVSHTLVPGT